MARISRRDFTTMCSGALTAGTFLAGWPSSLAALPPTPESPDDELTSLTLLEASIRIHNRSLDSVQLTKALLKRIGVYDSKLNAYITVMSTEALKQAAQLDEEAKAGRFRSPLHGIPIALKDNIDTAGTRTTAASPMFKTRVPTEDAEVVKKLKACGRRHSRASSTFMSLRSAAQGMSLTLALHATLGTCSLSRVEARAAQVQQWRRIFATAHLARILAAAFVCHRRGVASSASSRPPGWCRFEASSPASQSLDHCGPMARTVEDVALMLTQLAGYDNEDIFSVEHAPQDYFKLMKQPVSSFRLGAPVEFYDHLEPEVAEIVNAAIAVLTHLTQGVTSRATLPSIPEGKTSSTHLAIQPPTTRR